MTILTVALANGEESTKLEVSSGVFMKNDRLTIVPQYPFNLRRLLKGPQKAEAFVDRTRPIPVVVAQWDHAGSVKIIDENSTFGIDPDKTWIVISRTS